MEIKKDVKMDKWELISYNCTFKGKLQKNSGKWIFVISNTFQATESFQQH